MYHPNITTLATSSASMRSNRPAHDRHAEDAYYAANSTNLIESLIHTFSAAAASLRTPFPVTTAPARAKLA